MTFTKRKNQKLLVLTSILGLSLQITAFLFPAFAKEDAKGASSECPGHKLKVKIEMRFPALGGNTRSTLIDVYGEKKRFRNDIVIRNSDILKVERSTGQFGQAVFKAILTPAGAKKIATGTKDAIGKAAIVLVNQKVSLAAEIKEQISQPEIVLNLEKNTEADGKIKPYEIEDLCSP